MGDPGIAEKEDADSVFMEMICPSGTNPDDSPLYVLCCNDTCSFTWTGAEHINQVSPRGYHYTEIEVSRLKVNMSDFGSVYLLSPFTFNVPLEVGALTFFMSPTSSSGYLRVSNMWPTGVPLLLY